MLPYLLQCISISQLSGLSDLPYREFDTVGLVVCVTNSSRGKPIDQVFLADANGSVLKINVWDGLKVTAHWRLLSAPNDSSSHVPHRQWRLIML